MSASKFYDSIASSYHLIYQDWLKSMARQAEAIDGLIHRLRPGSETVLDLACGIGTQALGLAKLGYQVTASDISAKSVGRARAEATRLKLKLKFAVEDMRLPDAARAGAFDVVIAMDNAVPHLLSNADILKAFRAARRCLKPGGLYLISARDYDKELKSGTQLKHYGSRKIPGGKVSIFQTWQFHGTRYALSMYFVEESKGKAPKVKAAHAEYYAIGLTRLAELMKKAGFKAVKRMDGKFFQPVLAARA